MANPESVRPDKFRGITLENVINRDKQSDMPSLKIGKKSIARLEVLETQVGEVGLFVTLATRVQSGQSLRSIGREFNVDSKLLASILVAAGISYPSREEAVQKLWEDPEFRARNAQAQAESTNKGGWSNPEYRARILPKKREVMQRLQADPEFTKKTKEAVSKASKARWQDPEFQRAHADRLRARWENPEYRASHKERMLARWQDPEYRERLSQAQRDRVYDPETLEGFRERGSAKLKALWQDPDFRARQMQRSSEYMRTMRQNPDFVRAGTEASRVRLQELWQDPEYRERMSKQARELWTDPAKRTEASVAVRTRWSNTSYRDYMGDLARSRWQDPEYRERGLESLHAGWRNSWENDPDFKAKILEILNQARKEPTRRERLVLPTIYGYRSDIGFNANSAWEANTARVLTHIGRDFITRQDLELMPTQEYAHLFSSTETTLTVDFVTIDNRGQFVIYEIMAHPLKAPIGWAKFILAKEQYLQFRFVAITEKMYERIQAKFENRINKDPQFHGWENKDDNLKTNPLKYA